MAEMPCPICENAKSKVVDSRPSKQGGAACIKRRRVCENCQFRFTTRETVAAGDQKAPAPHEVLAEMLASMAHLVERMKAPRKPRRVRKIQSEVDVLERQQSNISIRKWCQQCDRQMTETQANACRDKFCRSWGKQPQIKEAIS